MKKLTDKHIQSRNKALRSFENLLFNCIRKGDTTFALVVCRLVNDALMEQNDIHTMVKCSEQFLSAVNIMTKPESIIKLCPCAHYKYKK